MRVIRGYKTELALSNSQRTACLKHAGVARYAYNWGLGRYQEEYTAGRRAPTAMSLHKELNALKKNQFPWMYEVSKCAAQEALRDLEKAYKHFWRRCRLKSIGQWHGKLGFPKPKTKKKGIGSFRLTGTIHVTPGHIQLPRLGKLRLKEKEYLPTSSVKILNATVSEKAGRWFISIQVEEEQPAPLGAMGETIGVDLGIKTLATASDGRTFANPHALRKNLQKLRRLSRQHARKRPGSKNKRKSAQKLARLHARIASIRRDTLHKATSALVAKTKPESERPKCIVIEDLNVSGMLKNRRLSRAIAEVGFSEFRRQITYKSASAGSQLRVVNRWFPSSKSCSQCGWVDREQTLGDRLFICQHCGYQADRDYNAALNLAACA